MSRCGVLFGDAVARKLEANGVVAPGEKLDGPWAGSVRRATAGGRSDEVPAVLQHKAVGIYLTPTRIVFTAVRGGGTVSAPLDRIVHARRTEDRDIELFLALALDESLLVVWRPSRGRRNDPGRELWQRRQDRIDALTGEDLYTRELVAGTAFLHVEKFALAQDAFSIAAHSDDPFVAAMSQVALGDIAAGRGEVGAAADHYRRAVAFRTPDLPDDSPVVAVVDAAREQLDLLPPAS